MAPWLTQSRVRAMAETATEERQGAKGSKPRRPVDEWAKLLKGLALRSSASRPGAHAGAGVPERGFGVPPKAEML